MGFLKNKETYAWLNQSGGGFTDYISDDEFFNTMGNYNSMPNTPSSPATGPATGPSAPSNNSNGLTAGVYSSTPSIPAQPYVPAVPSTPSIPAYAGTPAQPYVPAVPSTPSIPAYAGTPAQTYVPAVPSTPSIPAYAGIPATAYVPAVPSTPAYNPNIDSGLNSGVANSGQNPNQGCPCEYEMNCWSQQCPSTLSTYGGLSSPTCPTATQSSQPNCQVPATIGSPSIPASPGTPATAFVPAYMGSPEVQASPGTPATAFVPATIGSPAIPSTPAVPASYNMNCWSQTSPSNLNTYSGQGSASCPASTQLSQPSATFQSSFSGFNGENLWF